MCVCVFFLIGHFNIISRLVDFVDIGNDALTHEPKCGLMGRSVD